jgi:uncharacterized protein (DUF2141 family)
MKFKLLLLTIAFSTIAFLAQARITTNPTSTCCNTKKNDIAGGVIHADTKKPLSNVSITAYSVSKKEKVVITDNNGNYTFNDLKPGTYRLVFEKEGFKKVTREKVIIRQDEGCQLNVEMNENEEFLIMPGQLLFSDYQ